MNRALLLAVVLTAVGGCSTMTPARYAPSADTNQVLRKYAGTKVQLTQLAAPASYDANCRFMGPIQAADGQSIPEFVKNAFNDEFKFADIYSKDGISLEGALSQVEFSSISGVTDGWWELGIVLKSTNGKTLWKLSRTEFKSGFDAVTACNQTAQALGGAVQDLIKAAVTDPGFKALLDPSVKLAQPPQANAGMAVSSADPSLPPGMPRRGDRWKYRYVDGYSNLERETFMYEVVAVEGGRVEDRMSVASNGAFADVKSFSAVDALVMVDRPLPQVQREELDPYLFLLRPDVAAGFGQRIGAVASKGSWSLSARVLGQDRVVVPAGSFDAIKIEVAGTRSGNSIINEPVRSQHVIWYAPKAKRYVKYDINTWGYTGFQVSKDSFELVDFALH